MLKPYLRLPVTVYLLCLGSLINRAGTFVVPMMVLFLRDDRGLNDQQATLGMGIFGGGSMVAAIIGGQLADKFGRRRTMLLALFGGAMVLPAIAVAHSIYVIYALILLFAITAEMYRPGASAMIADVTQPAERPFAYGLMYLCINLGFSVGAVIGGWLIAHVAPIWMFLGDAATSMTYGLIVLFFVRETLNVATVPGVRPMTQTGDDAGESADVATVSYSGGLLDSNAPVPWRTAFATILSDGTFLVFCLGTLLLSFTFMQSISTLPLHLDNLGIRADKYGRLIAINGILIVVCQIPITAFITRFDRSRMLVLSSLVVAIGFGMTGFVTSLGAIGMSIVVWTVGEMMHAPFMSAIVADLSPERLRGRYMGVFGMSHSAANMVGAPLGGWILQTAGSSALWRTTAVAAVASAVLYFSVRKRLRPRSLDEIVPSS